MALVVHTVEAQIGTMRLAGEAAASVVVVAMCVSVGTPRCAALHMRDGSLLLLLFFFTFLLCDPLFSLCFLLGVRQ